MKQFAEKINTPLHKILGNVSLSATRLAGARNTGATGPIQVTNEHLFRAFDLVVANQSIRSHWIDWSRKKRDEPATKEEPNYDAYDSDDDFEGVLSSDADRGVSDEKDNDVPVMSVTPVENDDKDKTQQDTEKEGELEDEVVRNVRESADLSEHEKMLLPCIINRRTFPQPSTQRIES
ncbi:hypothetical protein AX16_001668 [Volvariella volvacea WC 439]|nr:hypothetical protein AX16_001668 [Volvariella volvacea WC 439]